MEFIGPEKVEPGCPEDDKIRPYPACSSRAPYPEDTFCQVEKNTGDKDDREEVCKVKVPVGLEKICGKTPDQFVPEAVAGKRPFHGPEGLVLDELYKTWKIMDNNIQGQGPLWIEQTPQDPENIPCGKDNSDQGEKGRCCYEWFSCSSADTPVPGIVNVYLCR